MIAINILNVNIREITLHIIREFIVINLASFNMAENGLQSILDIRQLMTSIIYLHGNINRFVLEIIGVSGRYKEPDSLLSKLQSLVSKGKTQRQNKGGQLLEQIRGLTDLTGLLYALHSQMENDFHQRFASYSKGSLFVQIINLCYQDRQAPLKISVQRIEHHIQAIKQHKQVNILVCSAVFQAFARYEYWFQSQGKYFSWCNLKHHQSGVARARRLNSDIAVHVPDLDYILERLREHLDFDHNLFTHEKSRLHEHSYDSFLLHYLFPSVNLSKFENRVKYKCHFLNWLDRSLAVS